MEAIFSDVVCTVQPSFAELQVVIHESTCNQTLWVYSGVVVSFLHDLLEHMLRTKPWHPHGQLYFIHNQTAINIQCQKNP